MSDLYGLLSMILNETSCWRRTESHQATTALEILFVSYGLQISNLLDNMHSEGVLNFSFLGRFQGVKPFRKL
jgi:hypothetical protein